MAVKSYEKGKRIKLSANFNQSEFDCNGNGCCCRTLIDTELVERLQKLRDLANKPVTLTCSYRCTVHNRNIGGVTNSNHTKGLAADIYITGLSPMEVAKLAETAGFREIICYYPNKNFCHVGTRPDKWFATTRDGGRSFSTVATFGGGAVSHSTVKKGSSNSDVKTLQTVLNNLGYSCGTADGIFGSKTDTAVRAYQKSKGLAVDGIVGNNTWKALGV